MREALSFLDGDPRLGEVSHLPSASVQAGIGVGALVCQEPATLPFWRSPQDPAPASAASAQAPLTVNPGLSLPSSLAQSAGPVGESSGDRGKPWVSLLDLRAPIVPGAAPAVLCQEDPSPCSPGVPPLPGLLASWATGFCPPDARVAPEADPPFWDGWALEGSWVTVPLERGEHFAAQKWCDIPLLGAASHHAPK